MLMKPIASSLLVLSRLAVFAPAQVTSVPPKLESGRTVEREIAGGESHTYQVKLTAGQLVRITLQQKRVDVAVQLVTPDSKPLVEVNFTDGFGQESLSQDVAVGGDYRIVIRTVTATARKGAYEAKLEMKAAATAQDKQRIEAERLQAEAYKLSDRGAAALEPTVEKAQQALSLWRGLGDRYWEAYTLGLIGYAYLNGNKHDQAIEYYNQALAIRRELKDRYAEANTLSGLAWINSQLNRREKAIEYYEDALRTYRELKEKSGVASAHLNLGFEHIQIGRYEKAIEYLEP